MAAVKKPSRVWYYKPGGWLSWMPFGTGHDEYARQTFWFGVGPLTGVVVVAYKNCGSEECESYMREWMAEEDET